MQLPLFALHAVLFPHLPMTLHVFEPRYRAMVADVVEPGSPFDGRLVVSMITNGPEVGGDADAQGVGTVAEIRSADRLADGRWWLSVVGVARARLGSVDRTLAYPVADATELAEPAGEGAPDLLPSVQMALDGYLATVKRFVVRATSGGEHVPETRPVTQSLDELLKPIHLPDDPVAASYAVAGVLQVELSRKQRLLELPDAASRLGSELALLRSETRLLGDGDLPTVPAADLGYHPN